MKPTSVERKLMLYGMAAFLFIVTGPWAAAFGAVLESKLTPAAVKAGQRFGNSVSVSGDTAVIDAPLMNIHNTDTQGQADIGYVFVRSAGTWTAQGRLTLSEGTLGGVHCAFCHTAHAAPTPPPLPPLYKVNFQVAVSGDTAIVAGGVDSSSPGYYQARISERSGESWTEKLAIQVPNGAVDSTSPIPVAIDGDTIALGTTVAADVYLRSGGTWTVQESVAPSDLSALTRFGHSLALSGNTMAVAGASSSDNAVYVFVRNGSGWTQEERIFLPAGAVPAGAWFPVALSGDTLLIGAPSDGTAGTDAGAVYTYERSAGTWMQGQTLAASDATAGQAFGFSLAVDGDKAVIGAKTERAAYVFNRNDEGWFEQEKIVPPSGGATMLPDKFPVSLSGDTMVIGASGDSEQADESGAVYVYDLHTPPTISAIADTVTCMNKSSETLSFAVNGETLDQLTVSGASSNTTLVADLSFGGSGADRDLTISLASYQSGTSEITVTVSDGQASASTSFILTVNNTCVCNDPMACPGGKVTVTPSPDVGVTVTFSTVTADGQTTASTSDVDPMSLTCPDTPNFQFETLGTCYDVHTTAGFLPPVDVCFTLPGQDVSTLTIGHYVSSEWQQLTEICNNPPDIPNINCLIRYPAENKICARIESFSWFVIARDATSPTFELNRLKDTLWPPNHKMVKVARVTNIADNNDPSPAVDIRVSSTDVPTGKDKHEKDKHSHKGEKDGKHGQKHKDKEDDDAEHGNDRHVPDWKVRKRGDTWEVWVRAERSGDSTDRIYTITATVTDRAGNQATDSQTVLVPHDKHKKETHGKKQRNNRRR